LPISFKNPVSKFTAHGQNSSEESTFDQMLQFAETRQKHSLLLDAVLDSRLSGQTSEFESSLQIFGNRLLAINMLACGNRGFDCGGTLRGDLSIEIDGDVRI